LKKPFDQIKGKKKKDTAKGGCESGKDGKLYHVRGRHWSLRGVSVNKEKIYRKKIAREKRA